MRANGDRATQIAAPGLWSRTDTNFEKGHPMDLRPALAIRLADEGVPLRAIARATSTPSDEIREQLHTAIDNGALLDLPREDWPPGFPRDQRALQLSRMMMKDRATVALALRRLFGLTATQGALLLTLLQSERVSKDRLGGTHRGIDVHVCNLRRQLDEFGIELETLHGYGYQLSANARQKITDMIVQH